MTPERWAEVERLCHAALAQVPDARSAFLADACRDDDELRREVTSLLAEQEAAETFLETPALVAPDRATSSRQILIGRRLGPYRVEGVVGAGGMGEVFRAWDTKLDRAVALKILPPEVAADPDRLARFGREARLLAGLNHPAILTVHDVGTDEGIPFVVTELLEGETLREVLARRTPTQRQVLEFALQAAHGLAAAHRQGIVHRDLKPENLFLTTDGRLKILDFGLAKRTTLAGQPAEAASEAVPTHPGVLLGTVAYMSPEQINGDAVDARADVFAFGIVLYELLTRQHPFRKETMGATLRAILYDTPPMPSAVHAAVPATVSAIARRCLAKAREDRYADAHELAQALTVAVETSTGAGNLRQVEERSPYPGLRSFTEQDAAVFVGRDAEVGALWDRIRAHHLLAVIGASGAGKTSFLRAGVVPARPEGWATLVCTPGPAPIRSLGQALTPALASDLDALPKLVAFEDPDVAVALLHRWRMNHAGALVIVDQFEELFTLNPPGVQERFAALLGRLSIEADVHVVIALRDDFLIHCLEQAPLAPVLAHLTALLPLGRDALRRALVEPAAARGYRFEPPALVEEMVSAVEDARAALPLLAFAVARLWDRRDRDRACLTRDGYEEIGGVAGALAQHAEATLDRIGTEREPLVRELFRNLVTAHGTRAVMDWDELVSVAPDRAAGKAVLRELVDARLLTSYELPATEGRPRVHRVEIAHESLLTAWPRLVRWRTQDEEGAQLRDQLKQAAHLWEEKGRTGDLLWTGTAFLEFALWRDRYRGALTTVEEDFARAMAARAQRRTRLRRTAVATVMAALAVVAIAIGISRQQATKARDQARAEARRAEASRLTALGRLELERYPTAALAYALRSLESSDTIEARLLALETLWRAPAARILPVPEASGCSRVMFSSDGHALACGGFSDKVLLWADDGSAPRVFARLPIQGDARSVGFDREGRFLLSWVPGDPELRGWPLAGGAPVTLLAHPELVRPLNGDEVATLGPVASGARERVLRRWSFDGDVSELARWNPPSAFRFRPPGLRPVSVASTLRWLAFGDGVEVVLRSLDPPAAADFRLGRHETDVRDVEFDPAGQKLVSVDQSGVLRLWSVRDRTLLRELRSATPHRYSRLVFDDGGTVLSWTSGEGWTHVWDLRAPAEARPLALRRTDAGDVGDEAFDPQGRWLASAAWGAVALWPIQSARTHVLVGHVEGPVNDLAFSPDSTCLASCTRDGALVWPLDAGQKRRVDLGADYYCYGVAFTPDGRELAVVAPSLGAYLVPLDGAQPRRLFDYRDRRAAYIAVAFNPAARIVAVAPEYATTHADMAIEVQDLATGARRAVPLWDQGPVDGFGSSASYLRYLADGRLIVAGRNGIRRWDPATGKLERLLWGTRFAAVDTDQVGRTIIALVGTLSVDAIRLSDPELLVIDPNGRTLDRIRGHGNALTPTLAVDARGRFLVTGDTQGIVRVGRLSGGEPHWLPGHSGPVERVAVSPDGRWIASASGAEIRLWPVPDLSKPPFHTLPYDQLMSKLKALTNLRVVDDRASANGYKVEVGPFPGWREVPTW